MIVNEEKYITFKREAFIQLMGELALPPWNLPDGKLIGANLDCAPIAENVLKRVNETELQDAVVIRRQDKFASPCLLTYAAMIALVAEQNTNRKKREELLAIADYFHQQGVLAGEEGCHLPTL